MTLWAIDISLPTTKVGRSTGFHTDQTWRDVGKKGKHFGSFELLVEQPLAVFVNSVDLETSFAKSMPIVLTFMMAAPLK